MVQVVSIFYVTTGGVVVKVLRGAFVGPTPMNSLRDHTRSP